MSEMLEMRHMVSDAVIALSRSFELSLLFKATVVAVLGLVAARMAGRASASARHVLIGATFGALLLLPAAAVLFPERTFEVGDARMGGDTASAIGTLGAGGESRGALPAANAGASSIASGRWFRQPFQNVLRAAWLAGAVLLFGSLVVSCWRLSRIRRRALPWPAGQALVADVADAGERRRAVDVLLHEQIAAPLTCGLFRPAILLPCDAPAWPDTDLRRAIVHELEHIRRSDWRIQLLARTVCAAYWFHPLVWVLWRQLCLEAERACDDAVVVRAERGDDAERAEYAEQLVALARRLSSAAVRPTVAMANRSDLSARVSALLDPGQRRRRAGVLSVSAVAAAATMLALALAPLRAVGASEPLMLGAALVTADESDTEREADSQDRPARLRQLVSRLDRQLYRAAERGNVERIAELLDAGANVNCALDGDGSPLIGAAREGRLEAVRLLLDRGADPNMPVEGDGNPIIMAAREGHLQVVALLLDRGANIDQIVPSDENALIQASGEGHLEVVKLLVARGADVNARAWAERAYERPNGEWRTPLSMARKGRHDEVVKYLLSVGAHE